MEQDGSAGLGIFLIAAFLMTFTFAIGFLIGTDNAQTNIKQPLCKQIYTKTNDYINCNSKDIDTVIKSVKPF